MADAASIQAVGLPFQEAIDYFKAKVPVHSAHWTDVWRTAHARSFMVAGAASDALLSDFQTAVDKAIRQGTGLAEFRRDFDTIVARHGWVHNGSASWRARVIYETNLNSAYAAGRWAQQTDPDVLAAYPYLEYVHSGSRHPRLQHLAWNGLTLRADDGFWETHYPPNGWRCGCRARSVSEGGLRAMGKGKPDAAPKYETRAWRNPHTGAVHQVPVGIDPGFDWNPGIAWQNGMKGVPVAASPLRPVLPPGDALVQDLQRFLADPVGRVPAGHVPEAVRVAIGAKNDGVLLSEQTFAKQVYTHKRDLTEADYLRVPAALAKPDRVVWGRGAKTRIVIGGSPDRPLAVVLKVAAGGEETWIQSVYPAWAKGVLK
jgi:hypothetical protein